MEQDLKPSRSRFEASWSVSGGVLEDSRTHLWPQMLISKVTLSMMPLTAVDLGQFFFRTFFGKCFEMILE